MCLPHRIFQHVNPGRDILKSMMHTGVFCSSAFQSFYAKLKAGLSNFQMTGGSEIQTIFSNAREREKENLTVWIGKINKTTWNLKYLNVRAWTWAEKSAAQIKKNGEERCQKYHICKRIPHFNHRESHPDTKLLGTSCRKQTFQWESMTQIQENTINSNDATDLSLLICHSLSHIHGVHYWPFGLNFFFSVGLFDALWDV